MNTRYNNKTHSMYVNFGLDENGNDRVRIGSAQRDNTGAVDTKTGISVTLYKNQFKTTREGQPNYRNVEVFVDAIKDIVKQYKENADTAKRQISCTYINSVTLHTIQYAFVINEKDGLVSYMMCFADSFEGETRKQIYRFKDEEELEQFTDSLKLFCDPWIHMCSHLIYSEMQAIINKSVGEQLQQIIRNEFENQKRNQFLERRYSAGSS